MMEIGEFICANRIHLDKWGRQIREEVVACCGSLLKMPPALRVKDVQSARAKQFKKEYAVPERDMTDLVGVRFVVLTSEDVQPIRTCLEQSPTWTCKQTRDPREEIARAPETFGYQSYHYEVRSKSEPVWCCEVQIRTLLQHAIAELSHDAMYKATQFVPSQAERLVARSMALMETTDELLCRAMQAVRDAQAPALAVQRAVKEAAQPIEGDNGGLLEELLSSYATEINSASAKEFQAFMKGNAFVLDKLRARSGHGLFAYPAAALLSYWLVSRLENRAERIWPFLGSHSDLQLILSDLGISTQ